MRIEDVVSSVEQWLSSGRLGLLRFPRTGIPDAAKEGIAPGNVRCSAAVVVDALVALGLTANAGAADG